MILLSKEDLHHTRDLLERGRNTLAAQRDAFLEVGATPEQAERGLDPMRSFMDDLEEQIAWYEASLHGEIRPALAFVSQGQQLVALRLARGLSQKELALRLGVSEAQVSRDEHNDYWNVSPEKAQRVLEALGGKVEIRVELTEETPLQRQPIKRRARPLRKAKPLIPS